MSWKDHVAHRSTEAPRSGHRPAGVTVHGSGENAAGEHTSSEHDQAPRTTGEHPASAEPAPRLDPFVLPAATTSRFLVLIVFVLLGAAVSADYALAGAEGWLQRYQNCARNADAGQAASPGAATRNFLNCTNDLGVERAGGIAAATLLVLGILLFWRSLLARYTVWREGLVSFDRDAYPVAARSITSALESLSDNEQVLSRLRVYVNEFRESPGGRALGSSRRPVLRLTRGPVRDAEAGHPEVLEALVRHEAAHFLNHDVVLTSLTVISGWVVIAIAVPLVVMDATHPGTPVARTALVWLASTGIVWLLRSAVIRSREHYADVRASTAAGVTPEDSVLRVALPDVPAGQQLRGTGRAARIRRSATALLAVHPLTSRRVAIVQHPQDLFGDGTGEALGVGIAAGLLLPYSRWLVENLLVAQQDVNVFAACAAVCVLVAAVVHVGLWRTALRSFIDGAALPRGTRPAVAVTAGIMGGMVLAPIENPWSVLVTTRPTAAAVLAAALLSAGIVYTRWCIATAAVHLAMAPTNRVGRIRVKGAPLGALALAAALGTWMEAVDLAAGGSDAVRIANASLNALPSPWVALPLVLAATVTLRLRLRPRWRRGPEAGTRRVYLDGAPPVRLPRPPSGAALIVVPVILCWVMAGVLDYELTFGGRRGLFWWFLAWCLRHGYRGVRAMWLWQATVAIVGAVVALPVLVSRAGRRGGWTAPGNALVAAYLACAGTSLIGTARTMLENAPAGSGTSRHPAMSIANSIMTAPMLAVLAVTVTSVLVTIARPLIAHAVPASKRASRRSRTGQVTDLSTASGDILRAAMAMTLKRALTTSMTLAMSVVFLGLLTTTFVTYFVDLPSKNQTRLAPPTQAVALLSTSPPVLPTEEVCTGFMSVLKAGVTGPEATVVRNAQLGWLALAADRELVRAFGGTVRSGVLAGDDTRTEDGLLAVIRYCGIVSGH